MIDMRNARMTAARPGAMWGALLAALGIVSLAGSVQAQQPGAGQPPRDDQPPRTGQPPRAGQPPVAADPAVVAVLEALERAGKELQTICHNSSVTDGFAIVGSSMTPLPECLFPQSMADSNRFC
jgi:hypothetical protein